MKTKNYKLLDLLKLWWIILALDLLTTWYALTFMSDKIMEMNQIMSSFFSLGWHGWLIGILFAMGVQALMGRIVLWVVNWKINSKPKRKKFIFLFGKYFYVLVHGLAVVNNLYWIIVL